MQRSHDRLRMFGNKRGLATAVSAAIVLALVSASSAMASSTSKKAASATAAPVKPDLSYFAGKTVTWIVPGSASSAFFQTAQIIGPLVASYLHATVNVESLPAGNGLVGQDAVYEAAPDGLTIGSIELATDIDNDLTNAPNINFSLQKVPLIAAAPLNPDVLIATINSGYKTIGQLMQTKNTVAALDYQGPADEVERIMFGAYGLHARFLTGYASGDQLVAGFTRGDGDVATQGVGNFASLIIANQATPLLLTRPYPAGELGYAQVKSLPTIANYFAKNKPKTKAGVAAMQVLIGLVGTSGPNQVYFAPPHTPAKLVAAWTAAFKLAMHSTAFRQQLILEGSTPGYIAPSTVLKSVKQLVKDEPLVQKYMNP